ncbi:Myosin heavy chain kinase c-like protein [Leptomonas pyrrhocoris]|uniref:Myosin heavy chain kinase c-like protein n=1 Tax=Leptomonas pyrrhocoris TaxID=157538 RepID=A0A0M9G044_LEPPY|nr:Myosin heavy chain kinase c-like protein [Leptomonas pyrrhocoris]KPA79479.1 Myosin heavy chain kinase c-like protein [Leptomonas pyrrhocoris]|eukprot:XP_015657918.1 Myosin heavy chain kinase c-like protein [Leptomonas pyrrhocoris]
MGSSPLPLGEETAAKPQHRAETMSSASDGSVVAVAGPSPLVSNEVEQNDRDANGRSESRQAAPPACLRSPHRERDGSWNAGVNSKDRTALPRPGAGVSLLPLLPTVVNAAKEASATDVQGSSHHLLIPPTTSLSTATEQLSASSDHRARRQQLSLMSSSRDLAAHVSGLNNSDGSFTLSPKRSTRDISSTGLRGPIPENAQIAAAAQSPMSHSGDVRLHPAASATSGANASHTAAETLRDGGAKEPLPLLTRSLVSSSGAQGRRLTGELLDADVNAAADAVATLPAPRSSSMSSMHRDDDGLQQQRHAVVVEEVRAVFQPPPTGPSVASPPPPSNGSNIEDAYRCFAPCSITPGPEGSDNNSRQQTSRFADEDNDTGENQPTFALCPTEAEEVTFSMVPVLPTEAGLHGDLPSVSGMATGPGNSHTSLQTPDARTVVSATGSAVVSGIFPPCVGGSSGAVVDAARRNSSSIMKNGSGDQDYAAAATAARGATEARRASDSFTEAVDPKAAKRHLKKEKKVKKVKKAKKEKQQLSKEATVGAGAAAAAAVAAHRSDSEMQRKRQRKKQEKREKMKNLSTEEQRRYKADHQRRRAAKVAQRCSNGASPAPEAGAVGAMVQPPPQQHAGDALRSLSTASPPPSKPHDVGAAACEGGPALVPLDAAHPPLSLTPEPPNLDEGDNGSANGDTPSAVLDMVQSMPQLANTMRHSGDDRTGGTPLLHALRQIRRCTSAQGPSVPLAMLSATPPHGSTSAPRNFRRRFSSEGPLNATPPYRAGGFLCLPVNEDAAGLQQDQQQLVELQSNNPGGATNVCESEEGAAVGSGAEECQMQARQTVPGGVASDTAPPFIFPRPPSSAAGSGTIAILELKNQHQDHVQPQQRPLQEERRATTPSLHGLVESTNEHSDDPRSVGDSIAGAGATMRPSAELPNVRVCAASSVSSHAAPPATASCAADDQRGVREEAMYSAKKNSDDDGSSAGTPQQQQLRQQRSDIREVESLSYYSSVASCSYSHSRGGSAHRHDDHREGRRSVAEARANYAAAVAAAAKSKKINAPSSNGLRRPSSPASSCMSLRSRSRDDESDVCGSSSYSYSYSSSTGGSSTSSTGSVMAETLPLKEGCSTAPPAAAFHDLKYRCGCVSQLQAYAETAVIHEWDLTEGCWGSVDTSVVLNPQPFAKGNMRASYYMIDMRRLNCMLVAKRYLKSSVAEDQYFDDVSMHSISGHWARLFNAMHPPKKVRFVPAAVLVLPRHSPPLVLAMEPLLTGKFVKYNNNCGYVRRNARWTPQAFSHFTYQASNHALMVVDIQGVDDYYTDPQILSPDGEGYGRGNLGKKGIRRFLESHKCNDVCRAVGLLPLRRNSKGAVVAPLMAAKNANGGSLPASAGAQERLVAASSSSGVKDERLPPKIHTLSQQGLANSSHGGDRSPLISGGPCTPNCGTSAGMQTQVGGLADGSRTGSEAGKYASPPPLSWHHHSSNNNTSYNHSSGLTSPNPAAALMGPSGYLHNGNGGAAVAGGAAGLMHHMNGGGGGSGGMVGAPALGYSVKYVPYPRHAMVRPQSQYFTSTIAGGLMAVPSSANSPGALPTPSSPALYLTSGMSGPSQQQQQQQQSSQQQHSPATLTGQAGAGGVGSAAVPLLRPPTMGRAGGGAGCGYPASPPNITGSDGFTSVSPQMTNSMRLESSLHPHPPKSRLSSVGGLSVGAPMTLSLSGGVQNVSRTNSFIVMNPVVQMTPEMPMTGGSHPRRQSFTRRPVFSAVEEGARIKTGRHSRR